RGRASGAPGLGDLGGRHGRPLAPDRRGPQRRWTAAQRRECDLMDAFTRLDAKIAPLPLANIDTDQIIPKQFLKTVEREGLAKGLFYDLRFDGGGREGPDFVLNRPEYRGAGVLVAGDNFGCGSSR